MLILHPCTEEVLRFFGSKNADAFFSSSMSEMFLKTSTMRREAEADLRNSSNLSENQTLLPFQSEPFSICPNR